MLCVAVLEGERVWVLLRVTLRVAVALAVCEGDTLCVCVGVGEQTSFSAINCMPGMAPPGATTQLPETPLLELSKVPIGEPKPATGMWFAVPSSAKSQNTGSNA